MQKFFNNPYAPAGGTFYEAKWKYAKSGILRNIETRVEYYKNASFVVRSHHPLVSLLNSLGVNQQMPLERYYDVVLTRSLFTGRTFGYTSSISKGNLHNGIFYGPKSKELILAIDDSFNPFDVHTNWRSTRSVNVLSHNRSDLNLALPDNQTSFENNEVCVIAINIAMLAVQYRAFCMEQSSLADTTGDFLAANSFVHKYILPNMLYSQTDIALFNRMYCLLEGAPLTDSVDDYACFSISYNTFVDAFLKDLLDYLGKSERTFSTILEIIPAISQDNMLDVMRLPDYAPTRQVHWGTILARLDAIDFLTTIAPEHGNTRNRSDVNYFLREFKLAENENIFNELPQEINDDVKRRITEIRTRVNTLE